MFFYYSRRYPEGSWRLVLPSPIVIDEDAEARLTPISLWDYPDVI
jgi:hypothetical protein